MKGIGITEEFIEQNQFTLYTLKTHICYPDEMNQGEAFEVHLQILDNDAECVHAFLNYAENKVNVQQQMNRCSWESIYRLSNTFSRSYL